MSTSKKDYEAIAAIITEERRSADTYLHCEDCDSENKDIASARKTCAGRFALQLASYFTTQDKQFDRARFLTACGVTE